MNSIQYLFIYGKVKKYLEGVPDPVRFRHEIGQTWEKIKAKSHNEEESAEAFRMICMFANIIEAAAEKGVNL